MYAMMYRVGPPREYAHPLAPRKENVVYTSPAISRKISTTPKPRPPTVHCSRFIFRRTPARKPMIAPSVTIAKITAREMAPGLISIAVFSVPCSFHTVCNPHAYAAQDDQTDQQAE